MLLVFGLLVLTAWAQEPQCVRPTSRPAALPISEQHSRGPQYGKLIVAGGSLVANSTVFQRFLEDAGGPDNAKILYIPTNGGGTYSTPAQREQELNNFLNVAAFPPLSHPVRLLHTYDRNEANEESFYAPIMEATGIWLRGGLPQHSYYAYHGTATQDAMEKLLERNGVIGGTSAGALMQSNIMCRADSRGNNIVLGEPREGFAFGQMENIVFDVHNLQRNRAHDLIEVFTVYPDMLGINIDEDTAVSFIGDTIEVVGTGWVQIFDPTLWQDYSTTPFCADFRYSTGAGRVLVGNHGRSHFLWGQRTSGGDRYNVRTRTVTRASSEEEIAAMGFENME